MKCLSPRILNTDHHFVRLQDTAKRTPVDRRKTLSDKFLILFAKMSYGWNPPPPNKTNNKKHRCSFWSWIPKLTKNSIWEGSAILHVWWLYYSLLNAVSMKATHREACGKDRGRKTADTEVFFSPLNTSRRLHAFGLGDLGICLSLQSAANKITGLHDFGQIHTLWK